MAHRSTRRLRPLVLALVSLGAAAVCIPAVAAAPRDTPSPSTPTVASVQRELGELTITKSQLVDQYDQAQTAVAVEQRAAAAARAVAAKAEAGYLEARKQLGATVTVQYESGTFSATGALLSSRNGETYLDQMESMSLLSDHTAQQVAQLETRKDAAEAATKRAARLLSQASAKLKALASKRDAVTAQVDKYTTLLASLSAAQRAAYLATVNPTPPQPQVAAATSVAVHADSKAVQIALKFALAQVGKPYSYGAAGPGSYDCSGLTMASYAAAGISLPHSAAEQYNYGTHVSLSALEPGDLIFFYQPIGHVTIYLGNGLMVSAPETGENVSVVPLSAFNGQITGATRLT